MSILYRGHSIDASYSVSVVAMFANRSGRNEQSLQRNFHRYFLPSLVHLAKGFQRRILKCEKLADDRRQMPSDGKSSYCLWQGELKIRVQNCIWTMTNRANLLSCQIAYLHLVMNYENPEYTHWSYVKSREGWYIYVFVREIRTRLVLDL